MAQLKGFRFYYDKDEEFLLNEELVWNHPYRAKRNAKHRLRMYANLFIRDIKKSMVKQTPQCILCGSSDKLEIDHIIPISKGGKNELSNMQVLCSKCNNLKRAN